MIGNKKVLAVIPARGGSKGLPRKNIRELAGKPLIAWTLEAAAASQYIDRCIVSTDDEEIAAVARQWGGDVPFLRPAHLAQDDTPGIAPVLHALDSCSGYDYVVLLQPTSPLRTSGDIDGCLDKLRESDTPSCVSVTTVDKSPLWMYTLGDRDSMVPLLDTNTRAATRQQLPVFYMLNGAVYATECDWLRKQGLFINDETVAYVMPRERSQDIDTIEEFVHVEWMIAHSR
ncbi:acylneuraminate cytidylyltransferase family protein [Paenibacillus rhizovicinus]|uniref:Acylneuraminate cytidylyltransferase family protein n=1 Tax=Paenibacillus rhizovicinus TaxID=2704463 RepID=A0A6C0P450_9BACL|nr:acylneuraminate cytidylyltransferase family protein [Paenibacillus rhizovicinus]QHW32613.1 acylneuraminate cytidylyltransferase family protein [Paenibacillus rhizovicinus]